MKFLNRFQIFEETQIYEARKSIANIARKLDFSEERVAKLSIATSEVASNMIKHGKGGELLIRVVNYANIGGLELLALDKGQGIYDVAEIFRDGFSTKGTLGLGIGSIRRASTLFDIYSKPGKGTVVLFRIWSKTLPYPLLPRPLEIGIVSLPKPNEKVSGDGWFIEQWENRSLIACIDGLGHGLLAEEASKLAEEKLYQNKHENVKTIMEILHSELKKTRGAAVAIADFRFDEGILHFSGIGNISSRLFITENYAQTISCHPGTVGYLAPKIIEKTYKIPENETYFTFTMHTDGLSEHWDIKDYPGLLTRHPSIVSGILYRDFNKNIDDVTVISARLRKGNLREP